MKKSIFYILISASTLTACKKSFTDISPVSARSVENYYRDANDMQLATNAIYKALQMNGTFNQGYWIMGEMRSDNTDMGADQTGLGADLLALDTFTENPATATILANTYFDSYVGVYRANMVLDRIDNQAITMTDALRSRLKGEALFLRSLFYYHIAVYFGKAPLILKEVTATEAKTYPQVNAETILRQVVTDLTEAENLLPSTYTGVDVGRATKGGAGALLGKVYLTLGEKSNAIAPLQRVISNTSYGLVSNYENIWGLNNKNNKESLFEVQFKGGGTNTGNAFTHAFTATLPQQTGTYRNRPTENMENAYEPGDSRKLASMSPIGDTRFDRPNATPNPITYANSRFCIKYGTSSSYIAGDGDYNWIFLRYSDVLLMMAEALGEGTEAYEYINRVRTRAGLANINASTPGTFEEKLLKERRVELAFESHRWPDLLRFGKATEVMNAQGYSNVRLLFPIPQKELDINSAYTQNPL